MPFPNADGKHEWDALVTPERSAEYSRDVEGPGPETMPEAVVLCYSRDLMEHLVETRPGTHVDDFYGDLYLFDETDGRVGVHGNFGIGAPTAAMVLEDLAAAGVGAFLSVGFAGCLDDAVGMGDVVVPDRAIRDEGTSHHYAAAGVDAVPTESLLAETKRVLRDDGDDPFHVGPTWTTDAIYRETGREVERYADEGVLTVEMEAAAVFTVAAHRGVDAAAMFVASDYLGPADWEPKFHLTTADLRRLGETAARVLAAYVGAESIENGD
ncbi:nucleoside phosphorylase [Halorarum halobium]|uniref:nucleoside phosphorylase n=1 Tax=Halorarum halobium TaxID=3075121 RepID=UPI0028A5E249|nr:nucleoside phosphorylase [Halobaculum sp. XH14]